MATKTMVRIDRMADDVLAEQLRLRRERAAELDRDIEVP